MSLELLTDFIEAVGAFFEDAIEGMEGMADALTEEDAGEATEEDGWRSRLRDRMFNAGQRIRGSYLYRHAAFYSVLKSGIHDIGAMFKQAHKLEKSALTKAEHAWKSVSDKVRHGHWFSSGHGHAMNGVTQGNYDFIVRRKRKHY